MDLDDELPVDVFTELGRVCWAAIVLEDAIKWLCSSIWPHDPRNRPEIRPMMNLARRELSTWPDSLSRKQAYAWIDRADKALAARNALFHATPLVWIGPEGTTEPIQQLLGEMPRRAHPTYNERPISVDALKPIRELLVDAKSGWRDVVLAVREAKRSPRS